MGRIGRWMIAIAVTVAAFTAGLVVSGLWILPRWVASSADRWVIAAACGTVVAALATAWAYDFARSAPTPDAGHTPSVDPPTRNVTVHGDNQGIISTGDNADNQLQ